MLRRPHDQTSSPGVSLVLGHTSHRKQPAQATTTVDVVAAGKPSTARASGGSRRAPAERAGLAMAAWSTESGRRCMQSLMRTLARTRRQRLHLAWYRWRKHIVMLAQALRSHAANTSATQDKRRGKRAERDVASTHAPAPSAEAKLQQTRSTAKNPRKPATAIGNTKAPTSSAKEYSRKDHLGVRTTTRMFNMGANSRRKQVWLVAGWYEGGGG